LIQGTSADVTKLACVYFYRYLLENDLIFKVKVVNVVHDEIIVECPNELSSNISTILQKSMEDAGQVFCKVVKLRAEPVKTVTWKH
jgi:DNA polymerase-1